MISTYNGQDATALATSSRPRNADRSRAAVPNYKSIPEAILARPDDFWARVDVDMYDVDACFPWKGCVDSDGYGVAGRAFRAHRIAFTLAKGAIPDGYTIDHLCGNRRCCNPAHLEAVTIRENLSRRGTHPSGERRKRNRRAGRYAERRARGLCVQCNTPSKQYRCDRCRPVHNTRQQGRKR